MIRTKNANEKLWFSQFEETTIYLLQQKIFKNVKTDVGN